MIIKSFHPIFAPKYGLNRFFLPVLSLIFLTILAGCINADNPLRVGANLWPGYEPLFIARKLGFYNPDTIKLLEFTSSSGVIRAYRNGLLDVAALTADEAILINSLGDDSRIILVLDYSSGADALIVKPEIRELKQIKGKKIGLETSALGAYMLSRVLSHAGLHETDIHIVNIPYIDHHTAFEKGRVDGIITFEPQKSRILSDNGHVIFDSSVIPGEIVDVLVVRRNIDPVHEKELADLIQGWFRALTFMQTNINKAADLAAERENIPPEEYIRSLQGLSLPDYEENLLLLGNSESNFNKTLILISEIMSRYKLLPGICRIPPTDDRFIRKAKR